ncbi:MAG: hypothetical protein DWB56_14570 [Candidatus Jettenia sp.]|uniref:Uncharacterized protein n=1 Tax=Candidatus Jettenia caeni TaxID=247490 RepID=I3IPE1_9BACT|nr:hypothetical protein [Candidatus Jettenia sp. AMX1]MBC6930156.1 hypothetical protein [Candidatus Jettenia sp.]NUN22433.1 hypothetical protein [Candidatus Jettenia caeni]KAA0248603.1 MAG: hypothetical protein EDM77_11935 [Candidatus Jettenia sp. AMX1]MCE7881563.1 hypothetical protein [Candidatus Jettenia sp. AMX1]MCQ3927722.1 hypothetical protein [Candidatus Jettenia sp.]
MTKRLTDFFAYGGGIYTPIVSPTFQPRTVGELRRRLAELGNPWFVDERLGDDDPLPEYPMGTQAIEEIPTEIRSYKPTHEDFDRILKQHPPGNPFLRLRWIELGLLSSDDPGIHEGTSQIPRDESGQCHSTSKEDK